MGTFVFISLKIAKLRDRTYYYFCILGDVDLNYHLPKFGSNYTTQCGYMDKTVSWRPETCLQFKDGFRRRT